MFLFLVLPLSIIYSQVQKKGEEYNKKAGRKERKADRIFTHQEFDKAMLKYEEILDGDLPVTQAAYLHLKTARLYLNLLDYTKSIPHYEQAMIYDKEILNTIDICNYLDALRYRGQRVKAISLAMQYAYKSVYQIDQRFQNILHALNYEGGFMPVGSPEYTVVRDQGVSSSNSQFWVGNIQNEFFYAESDSRFHDPNKRFYHRTHYQPLGKNSIYANRSEPKKGSILSSVPVYLQNGPIAFSSDMKKIIVTQVSYKQGERVDISQDGLSIFPTKLYYSQYSEKRNGWSSFKEAFPQKEGASYSHPYIFNNDRSILFASNMPGGYGGYDIYVAHWDDETGVWGEPINLGSQVNTEGNEISPSFFNDLLIFASNGLVGFGGYDLYSINWTNGQTVNGSLYHFDYPINTVMNDFGMLHIDKDKGYIVSDRLRLDKDDIFYFERSRISNTNNLLMGMSESRALSTGVINFSGIESTKITPESIDTPPFISTELLFSIYFDFDRYHITEEGQLQLYQWLSNCDFSHIQSLLIDGYADEIGTKEYNYLLSQKRAHSVFSWLSRYGVETEISVTGHGHVFSDTVQAEENLYYSDYSWNQMNFNKRVWQNRKARRVDIKAVIKQ